MLSEKKFDFFWNNVHGQDVHFNVRNEEAKNLCEQFGNNDKWLYFDTMEEQMLLLTKEEMKEIYSEIFYGDDSIIKNFEDFLYYTAIEFLKMTNYAETDCGKEKVFEIFKKKGEIEQCQP